MFTNINQGFLIEATLLDNTTGESIKLEKMLVDLMIKRSFIKDVFPLFVFDFKLTQELRDKMRDDDINIQVRISNYNITPVESVNETDNEDVTEEEVLLDSLIRIYEKPFDSTVSKKEEESDSSDEESSEKATPFFYYRVSGIPEEIISMNDDIVNFIYKNTQLTNVLINLLTRKNERVKLNIEPLNNKDVLKNIVIPPLNLFPALSNLDNVYKFYNYGANFFLDVNNNFYCYSPFSSNIPYSNKIEYIVIDPESTSNMNESGRPMKDENNNIQLVMRSAPSYEENEKVTSHSVGSNIIFYSYDDNFNLNTRTENNEKSFKKTRYFWDNYGSMFEENQLVKTGNSNESVGISLSNVNPFLINPFTVLRVTTDKYGAMNGDYTIGDASSIFSSDDMIHFKSSIAISALKK